MITQSEQLDASYAADVAGAALAMRSPLLMAERFSNGAWKRAPHLAVIDWEFRNLLQSRDIDILIVKAPVRHGKSEYLARWAAAWYLLRNPHKRLMICTNTRPLATTHSRWVRDKVHELSPMMGLRGVNPKFSAVSQWQLDGAGMGGCLAAGVGGAIPGFGADLLLIDDYMKNAKEAFSQKVRNDQWDWFQSTSSTRLEPGAKMVLLCTQWHEDDLIGRVMAKRNELNFRVRCITLQALREDDGITKDPLGRKEGEALWPERWPVEVMQRRKKQAGNWWHSIYQGRPKSDGYTEFPSHYFANIWAEESEFPLASPLSSAWWDPAKGKNKRANDYSAIVSATWSNGRIVVESDIDRRNVTTMLRDFVQWNRDRKTAFVGIEGNAFQELLANEYWQACEEVGYHADVPDAHVNTVPKRLRIARLHKWFASRLIVFRKTTSNELLVQQLKNYPYGDHDDGPDALENAIRQLCNSVDALRSLFAVEGEIA